MESMNISLPESLKTFVDEQIASGHYSSVSEYVRALIREDEKQKSQIKLEELLRDGLNSPVSQMTSKDWAELMQKVMKRHAKRTSK